MAFSKMKKKATTSAKKGKGKKNRIARNAEASVDELLAAAEAATASLDVEKAIGLYSQTASLLRMGRTSSSGTRERDLVQVLEKLGEAKVSMGDQEGAKQDFQEAIQLLDKEETKNIAYYETRSSLLFYFGQLCVEQEALNAYKNGISDLESCLSLAPDASANSMEEDEATNDKFLPELRKKLSGAFCTLVELYLTDLCYEEDAENECELYLEKALQIKDIDGDPVVDALQTMASFRLSQESRRAEAIPYILRTYEKMKIGSEALASLVGLGDPEKDMDGPDEKALELTEVDAANNLPEFEFRCQTAKLLLECAALLKDSKKASDSVQEEEQCVSAAISVLGSLLAQNDEVVEIWFLAGCAFAAKNPPMVESAHFYLQRAMEMLSEIKKALQQEVEYVGDEVEKQEIQAQLEENQTQIDDVQTKLNEHDGTSSMEE